MIESNKNLAWLIFARLVVVSLFLGSITYFNIRQPDLFTIEMLHGVTRLIAATFCFSIISLLFLKILPSFTRLLGYAQIVWEVFFVTILILITGGISSTYAFLFNLVIISACYLFGRREAFYTASLCGIIYGVILDLHYYGHLQRIGLKLDFNGSYSANYVLSLIFINLLAYFLTAILAGYLAERARVSESALKEKEIDYEELEQVNSLIVSSLDSGLITTNSQGRIRVFNNFAAQLTCIDQQSAYDLTFSEVFPDIDLTGDDFKSSPRKEITYLSRNGGKKILSVKSAPLLDRKGNSLGAVIDIRDMTQIREMELRLKKIDRLAAIGELSARIAHEVRNPLASISGSVQLLAEADAVPENDKKLLNIVLRETARLDTLVSEFLQYARPIPPSRRWFSLKLLISELISLIKADNRFQGVTVCDQCEGPLNVYADHDQFRQVIWNLLLNSAEAMPDGGSIFIESVLETLPEDPRSGKVLKVTFADSGHGISEQQQEIIFEPFFTTKTGGTGLGLASVYRILEAHDCMIAVASASGGGAAFTITIPLPDDPAKTVVQP